MPPPTIVWYHGGGWTTGSLDTGDILARALCHGTPAVVASVEYRLAPEHPWPASVEDSTSALHMIGLSPAARSELGRVGASVRDTLGTRVA